MQWNATNEQDDTEQKKLMDKISERKQEMGYTNRP
jgi:hypothetical protein